MAAGRGKHGWSGRHAIRGVDVTATLDLVFTMTAAPIELMATALFVLAVLQAFCVKRFAHWVHRSASGSVVENLLRFLVETEVVFDLSASVPFLGIAVLHGSIQHTVAYIGELNCTEPKFVLVGGILHLLGLDVSRRSGIRNVLVKKQRRTCDRLFVRICQGPAYCLEYRRGEYPLLLFPNQKGNQKGSQSPTNSIENNGLRFRDAQDRRQVSFIPCCFDPVMMGSKQDRFRPVCGMRAHVDYQLVDDFLRSVSICSECHFNNHGDSIFGFGSSGLPAFIRSGLGWFSVRADGRRPRHTGR